MKQQKLFNKTKLSMNTCQSLKASTNTKLELFMKVIGAEECAMDKEQCFGLMVPNMKENGSTTKHMVKEFSIILMAILMKASG